jgi:hypothetical protein
MDVRYLSAFEEDQREQEYRRIETPFLVAAGISFIIGLITIIISVVPSKTIDYILYVGYGLLVLSAVFAGCGLIVVYRYKSTTEISSV